jgi:hypothetical protein
MRKIQGGWSFLAAGVALALVLSIPTADAAEISRDDYVAQVEPICKTNVLASKRIFKGAKGEVKAGRLKAASTHFFRAATAFARTIDQIEAVPGPSADEARLSRWFGYLRVEREIIKKIAIALDAGDRHQASSYSVDLNANSNHANNTVLGFGFDYCRIDPARFG